MIGPEFDLMPIFAAAQDLDGSFKDRILFQITGFIIVMTVLTMLWGAISIIGALFSRFHFELPKEAATRRSVQPPSIPVAKPPLTPHHVAAITAALHTVIKGPYQIVEIKELSTNK
jgi:Na+-transporting methylmalonyl-CoA/oxaloacetate decarboxylase gamma subunit